MIKTKKVYRVMDYFELLDKKQIDFMVVFGVLTILNVEI